jgi:alkanesulfonate monooxygenase SsuD/methylene tetrahydromethanopterin reductase-like flavin-dependent oxidoreductase (luciferase family)
VTHRAPNGLGRSGRKLWREIVDAYEIERHELPILETAARVADQIAELAEDLQGAPTTVAGSQGQDRVHPLVQELRLQRDLLTRLLARLSWPDVPDEDGR